MPVLKLEHVNIRTPDPERTIAFFRDVLLMTAKPSPRSTSTDNGAWIYDDTGLAVVHIARIGMAYPSDTKMPFKQAHGSGALHHVALQCSAFEATLERITSAGLDYYENNLPQMQLRQLFVSDPNGILFELNFPGGTAT
jgi:catechol 2,3-dioxygenase-like lactoylglutathione lyase family enzyme